METRTEATKSTKKISKKTMIKIVSACIIIALLVVMAISYQKNNTPEKKELAQTNMLLKNIGKHHLVPNEQPIIATINEADMLIKEQPFYANVQNGDKLVIFPIAQKAIIYSPKLDVIINSGPFIISESQK